MRSRPRSNAIVPAVAVSFAMACLIGGCCFFPGAITGKFGTFNKVVILTGGSDQAPDFNQPAYIRFGPDGRLYVTTYDGALWALTLDSEKEVTKVDVYRPIADRMYSGLAFDPDSTANAPVLYLTHNAQPLYEADDFTGAVSRLSGPNFSDVADLIQGLPRSFENHMTFALAFGADGRLYIAQGGNTNHGLPAPGSVFGDRPESELSAALLVADVKAAGFDGLDDVEVYAPGLRNTYGLCLHSNGKMYVEDQGGNKGLGGRPGPNGVGSINVDVNLPDELNCILPDRFYGHPNPARGEFEWRADLADGTPHSPPLIEFPMGSVVTGLSEYNSSANDGSLQGALLLPGFLDGSVHYVLLSADGETATEQGILAFGFVNPLDVTVGDDGTIYVLEAGGTLEFGGTGPAKITALIPQEPSS